MRVLSQLRHFWNTFQVELAIKGSYKTIIGGIRLKLQELQEKGVEARKIRIKKRKSYERIDGVLHY